MTYISPSKVFAHLDRVAQWQRGETPAPVMVEMDLSNVCSLGCQSCHFAHTHVAGPWAGRTSLPPGYGDTGRFMELELAMRVLPDLAAAGVQAVVWSGGGEPTLHPHFDAIVATAHACGLQQGIYTLGGHLSAARAAMVRDTFTWVVVSLDAPDAETYATEKHVPATRFAEACEGIRRLSGGTAVIGASFLLHAGNWSRTDEMLALSRELGAHYTTFRPTIETSPDAPSVALGDRDWVTLALLSLRELATQPDVEVDPDRFVEYRDWTGHGYAACYGVRLVTQITPDGRVWICPNRRGMAGSELGDLRTERFSDLWARHPGQWTDFADCRVMCRLHLVNCTLDEIERRRPQIHEAFV